MIDDAHFEAEEPWEAEIGALLRALPSVEPPDGFLAAVVDRRPLHAGRTLLALTGLAVGVLALTALAGLSDAARIIPDLDGLTRRHLAAQARFSAEASDTSALIGQPMPSEAADLLVRLPDGYQRAATMVVDDVSQAVYAREGGAVSIFAQEGEVDWTALPATGRRSVAGFPAWVDDERSATVVQVGDAAIAIVGVGTADAEELVEALRTEQLSWFDRLGRSVDAVTVQLGFPAATS